MLRSMSVFPEEILDRGSARPRGSARLPGLCGEVEMITLSLEIA